MLYIVYEYFIFKFFTCFLQDDSDMKNINKYHIFSLFYFIYMRYFLAEKSTYKVIILMEFL